MVRGTGRRLEVEVRDGALRVLPPRRVSEERVGGVPVVREEGNAGPAADAGEPPEAAEPCGAAAEGAPESDPGEGEAVAGGEAIGTPGERPAGADLVLAGSVPDFLRFLGAIRRDPLPENPFGRLEVGGAADVRTEFLELLRRVDPDYEALLARAVGGGRRARGVPHDPREAVPGPADGGPTR